MLPAINANPGRQRRGLFLRSAPQARPLSSGTRPTRSSRALFRAIRAAGCGPGAVALAKAAAAALNRASSRAGGGVGLEAVLLELGALLRARGTLYSPPAAASCSASSPVINFLRARPAGSVIPRRMRALIVPSGAPSVSAISLWVSPLKKASSSARRCSRGNRSNALRTAPALSRATGGAFVGPPRFLGANLRLNPGLCQRHRLRPLPPPQEVVIAPCSG